MAFQLSPGVNVTERDLTLLVPSIATTPGAFAGSFQWGPVDEVVTVDSEQSLVERFGTPNDNTFVSFFTAANFLSYGNNLQLVRVANQGIAKNATAVQENAVTSVTVTLAGTDYTEDVRANTTLTLTTSGGEQPTVPAELQLVYDTATNVVSSISVLNSGTGYTANAVANTTISIVTTGDVQPSANATATAVFTAAASLIIPNQTNYLDQYSGGQASVGPFAAKFPGSLGNSIRVSLADSPTFTGWTYATNFDSAPSTSSFVNNRGGGNDEIHLVVIDELGLWTGVAGSVLERFSFLSKASDAKRADGSSAYYKEVINNQSKYIWWMDHPVGTSNWGSISTGINFSGLVSPVDVVLRGGVSADVVSDSNIIAGYNFFQNEDLYDVSLIPVGGAPTAVASYVISNIAETRRDCVVFVSPALTDVVNNFGDEVNDSITTRTNLPNSSYAVMDSGWKYQYDRYNDVYRYVPLNGDTAGLCVRTDLIADPWFSPGGFNRGNIKNVIKLPFSPSKAQRDELYKRGINPVVSFPGQGTVLYGDKTMLNRPTAFDRINVRRLFIVLEKAIATAAKFQLFEFNDAFTRSQFKNIVEPFMRNVQGRRGITDYRVVCDETNNTPEIIDRNEFVADIYIKPSRSINFIQLNFIATRTGVAFEEIGA